MSVMVSQIPGISIICSTVYSSADLRQYHSSMSLAFVRGIHQWPGYSPHKRPVTWKMFPLDDIIEEMVSEKGPWAECVKSASTSHFPDISHFYLISDIYLILIAYYTGWSSQDVVLHYSDVIMSVMASQITSLMIVYSTFYWKHQSSASLALVWGIHQWPVNSPHKGPVTRKMYPFHDVIMRIRDPIFLLEKFV